MLFPFQLKASGVFPSLFLGLDINKGTKGKEGKSIFFPPVQPGAHSGSHCTSCLQPPPCLLIQVQHWQKPPWVSRTCWGDNALICCCGCLLVSVGPGPSPSCSSQYLFHKILQPSCPSDLLPNQGSPTGSQRWLQTPEPHPKSGGAFPTVRSPSFLTCQECGPQEPWLVFGLGR